MAVSSEPTVTGPSVNAGREPLKVLLVEDDSAIAKLIAVIIEKSGPYSVQHVDTIADAISSLKSAPYDAALLDLELPDSSGIDTVRAICGRYPALPVVVLTSHSDQRLAQQALREGAEDFVTMGTSIAIMIDRALRYSLERKRVASELERQKSLFEAVFRDVPDAMILSTEDREIVLCNPGFERIFDYQAMEVVGRKSKVLYANSADFEEQGRLRYNVRAPETREPYVIEYRREDSTEFPGETVGTVIRDSGGGRHSGFSPSSAISVSV